MFEDQKPLPRLALKIGIAGFIGFGALATGMFVTRKGRHLVREAWQGRERTRIEDRVLDGWWDDPRLARRTMDVHEVDAGHIEITGTVRTPGERRRAVRLAKAVPGVNVIDDHLEVVAPPDRTRVALRRPAVLGGSRRTTRRLDEQADADDLLAMGAPADDTDTQRDHSG
jgi:hypothetical protein